MSYLSRLINEHQNQKNIFINFSAEDEEILKQYIKGMNEEQILDLIQDFY